ncbi:MAG: hypothetical protein IT377_17200 [Polyangiaceae bacterium]|nr:hypothetical protein [Polyangiaceae bacterium]
MTPTHLRLRDHGRFVAAVYEVKVEAGEITHFDPLVMSAPPRWAQRCHETLFNAAQPCKGCPALAARRTGTRAEVAVLGTAGASFRLALADPLGDGRFRLHVMQLTDAAVGNLSRARIDRRSQRAELSTRERAVLDFLLLGRTSADISDALGITERTARFHVANVLRKLEVESRTDLFRLLL